MPGSGCARVLSTHQSRVCPDPGYTQDTVIYGIWVHTWISDYMCRVISIDEPLRPNVAVIVEVPDRIRQAALAPFYVTQPLHE